MAEDESWWEVSKNEYNIQDSEVSADMEEAQVTDELSEEREVKDSPESE